MTFRQLNTDRVAGLPLQPVVHLRLLPEELDAMCGIRFETERDDLDEVEVAALEVDDTRFLLRSWANNPVAGTEVHTPDAGDPADQARQLAGSLSVAEHVDYWWDGQVWHAGQLPARAA